MLKLLPPATPRFSNGLLTVLCLLTLAAPRSLHAGDWPQFRGPRGDGHAEAGKFPRTWSEESNIRWRVKIPGKGWSSPVIVGDEIWMTSAVDRPASEEEKRRKLEVVPNPNGLEVAGSVSLFAVGVSRSSGELLGVVELMEIDDPEPIHTLNTFASPTPVLENDRLYCHFGTYGTVCLNTKSRKVEWTNRETRLDHQNGPGSSPILFEDLLILHCDGMDTQYVAALNKHSGELVWKTHRSGELHERLPFRKAYSTPLIVTAEEGSADRPQLLSPGADWVYSYDPRTGAELWRVGYGKLGFSNVPRPVVHDGKAYICTCFMSSSLLAIDFAGAVATPSEATIAWQEDRQMPKIPSPIIVGDELFAVNESGIATCLDTESGKLHWRKRLGGNFAASPIYADGKIYFPNREGETFVLAPGTEFRLLETNVLNEGQMASPAALDNTLYLRTESELIAVGE